MKHFIDFSDLSMGEWASLYELFEEILAHPADYADAAHSRVMGSLFFEPSTRTSFSFQAAMLRLGGGVFSTSDPNVTSVSKGETLKDTIIMCSGYADVLVVRHPCEGAALASSLYSRVPVINAGDGGHLHPTQTLTDLATITRMRGGLSGLRIGICGDLKHGRTAHSLIRALSSFRDVRLHLISPRDLAIPEYLRAYLRKRGQQFLETPVLEDALPALDVLYMTRIQRERFSDPADYERHRGVFLLTADKLRAASRELLILHPLPRLDELAEDVDADSRALYFEQARLAMYVRMALLLRLLDQTSWELPAPPTSVAAQTCQNVCCITRHEAYLPVLAGEGRCFYCEKRTDDIAGI